MDSETICHYCGEKLPHEKCSEVKKPESGEFQHICCEPSCGADACKYCGYCRTEHSEDSVNPCPDKPKHRTTAKCDYIDRLTAENKAKDDVLRKINDWCRAYPLEVFPKPDKEYFAKAHAILKQNELSLTRISADNMRHVLVGIQKIIEGEAKDV